MRIETAWVNSLAHGTMLNEVNLHDYAAGRRILRAVEELQRAGPKSGERFH